MTHEQYEILSNRAIVVAAVLYFIGFLAYIGQWSALRQAAVPVRRPVAVGATDTDEAAATAESPDQPEGNRPAMLGQLGFVLTAFAAVAHLVATVARGLAADPVRVPWGNMYEFTMSATLIVTVCFLLLQKRWRLEWLGPVVTGFVLVTLMADALLLYQPVTPLQDSLQSPWLVIHVIAAVIATAVFTIGGMCSVLYLIKSRWPDTRPGGFLDRVPTLEVLDRIAYRMHAFGFPVWTFAALITGPIWAQNAWGRYWGWDPKEIWAFITWVVYAAYLHARATAGWKGKAAAIVALIGLATLWFNFVGINFFFGSGSKHSYA